MINSITNPFRNKVYELRKQNVLKVILRFLSNSIEFLMLLSMSFSFQRSGCHSWQKWALDRKRVKPLFTRKVCLTPKTPQKRTFLQKPSEGISQCTVRKDGRMDGITDKSTNGQTDRVDKFRLKRQLTCNRLYLDIFGIYAGALYIALYISPVDLWPFNRRKWNTYTLKPVTLININQH